MSSKREEEKNEKIIRGLMKLPPNRRCINCNSLGPQYVCTNFWTFVCLICSGIHREFTHRVKSVSMAKFTSQEVDALQKGGNQRARELFLKSWDQQKQRLPDNSNADKVREFIKNVYAEKRYATEKSSSRPPRDSQNHEDETRRASSYHSYSQSPPYDFQYEERRYGKNAPALTRKPGSDRALYEGKFSSFLSPSRLCSANEGSYPRGSDYSVSSGGDPFRPDVLSSSPQREIGSPASDTSSHISHTGLHNSDGNNVNNGGRIKHPQRTTSSGSFGSFDSMSFKSVNSMGLQDVSSEPEQSSDMLYNKTPSFPSPPQNSIPTTFNGLDFFSEPFAPQNVASTLTAHNIYFPEQTLGSPVDLFQQSSIPSVATFSVPQNHTALPKQESVAHSKGENPELVTPNNGGWAAFDVPQNSLPVENETPIPSSESFSDGNKQGIPNPFSFDHSNQNSTYHEPSTSKHAIWHDGLQNVVTTSNGAPLWKAFEDFPGQQSIKEVPNNGSRAAVLHALDSNKSCGFGVYKALDIHGNLRTLNEIEPPLSSLSSHFGLPAHDVSMVPVVAGARSLATGLNPTNPFDLPCDATLDSSNMISVDLVKLGGESVYNEQFWDMSSLQATLPNNHVPTPNISDANGSWFPQTSVTSSAPGGATFDPQSAGSFEFLVERAPNTRMSTAPQGPVNAPVGGNPFA